MGNVVFDVLLLYDLVLNITSALLSAQRFFFAGAKTGFVVTKANDTFHAAAKDGKLYIGADSFENGTWERDLIHEYTHFEEGSKEYENLAKFLTDEDLTVDTKNGKQALYKVAAESVLSKGYGFTAEEIGAIIDKKQTGKDLTAEEADKYSVFNDELMAHATEHLLGNEAFIDKLVAKDAPLARKIFDKLVGVCKTIGGKGASKTLRTAQKLYIKAAEQSGNTRFAKYFLSHAPELEEEESLDSESERDATKYSFKGRSEDGRGIYESNFPKGTPKAAKSQRVLDYIKNVWSKKPIDLVISNGETARTISAQFDPTVDAGQNTPSDASKIAGGNRHGNHTEQRVTLDLADDYYQLASESVYNYSKEETGKDSATHSGVKMWHYFVNDILFSEYGEKELTPYTVTINVKEKTDGNFVYSFSAEKTKELSTRQTLHAAVNTRKGANGELFINSISEVEQKSNTSSEKKSFQGKTKFSLKDSTGATLDDIKAKYQPYAKHLYINENHDRIALHNIVIKETERGKGIGQAFLEDLIAYADAKGKIITLTPTREHGTYERLKRWYRQNGFVENKGRNADYRLSDTMYRLLGAATSKTSKSNIRFSFKSTKSGMANDALSAYDEELTRLIGERGDIIVDSYEKLVAVVDLAFDDPNHKATAYFGIISPDTLEKIKNSVSNLPKELEDTLFKAGKDYSIAATLDSIRHLVDDKNLDHADIVDYVDRLADTIVDFDRVTFHYYSQGNVKHNGLLFKKRFDDGTYLSFDLVSHKKRSLSMQTFYMEEADYQKKKRSAETLLMPKAPALTSPEAQVGQTSTDSIAQKSENVKRKKSTAQLSLKSPNPGGATYQISDGQIKKMIANYTRSKTYSKKEADEAIHEILKDTLYAEDEQATLRGKSREEVVNMLWQGLNAAEPGKRSAVANKVADYVIEHTMLERVLEDINVQIENLFKQKAFRQRGKPFSL